MSDKIPRVSVLMPVYNGGDFLHLAIDSVIGQTFEDFEFLIIDDGSTDQTSAVIASYRDPRIICLRNNPNIGQTRSMNRGLGVARGEFIARMDADDISAPGRLARLVAYLGEHSEVGLVSSAVNVIDSHGQFLRLWEPCTDQAMIQEMMLRDNVVIHGASLYRRRCLDECGGSYRVDWRFAQDYEIQMRFGDGWNLANLGEPLYYLREHPGSTSVANRQVQQNEAAVARKLTVQRRLKAARAALGLSRESRPLWFSHHTRRSLAERLVWWAAGVSGSQRRRNAFAFLCLALISHPLYQPVWDYARGVAQRKTNLAALIAQGKANKS